MNRIDTSVKGILGLIGYGFACTYEWIISQGIEAYVIFALAFFMFLDMLLAWIKHAVVKSLPNPSSQEAKLGIVKKLIILLVPLIVGVIYRVLTGDNSVAMKIINVCLVALTVAEGYSNIGHIYTIYTGEIMSEYDAVTFFIKKLGSIVKTVFEKIFNVFESGNKL